VECTDLFPEHSSLYLKREVGGVRKGGSGGKKERSPIKYISIIGHHGKCLFPIPVKHEIIILDQGFLLWYFWYILQWGDGTQTSALHSII
jgi:hypothetical protein